MTTHSEAELVQLRKTVPESFNSYQATVAMLSIFLGFVFAGLLQVLSSNGSPPRFVVGALITALLGLMTSLLFFHLTAHQVFKFWKIFFPNSWVRTIGGMGMNVGLLSMFVAVFALLREKQMYRTGLIVLLYGILLMVVVCILHFRLLWGAKHVVWVGRRKP